MKILVCGDLHMKDSLSYADHLPDRREGERKEILDFIVDQAKDCSDIIFLGDNFNSRNNSSETNREFVKFLERFGTKSVYIISGNHEKKGNGNTAIDFLGEIKNKPHWHIFTRPGSFPIEKLKIDFLPYMLNSELGVEDHEAATKKVMKELDGGDILFAHHAISGTMFNGITTNSLNEIVLPKEKLEKKYKLIVAGHIHTSQRYGNVLITGNVFTSEIGQREKFVYKIKDDLTIETLKVPAREIYKIENPTDLQLSAIPKNTILKVIITDKKIDIEEMKKKLEKFDANLLIEDYPNSRKKAHIKEGGAFDFSIEALLELYSKEKDVDYQRLLKGLQIVNG